MQQNKIEVVVVFKKEIELEYAQTILQKTEKKTRTGMDSSRGKLYFYSTGPKFIVTFETANEKDNFIAEFEQLSEIHEVYTPDWEIQKD